MNNERFKMLHDPETAAREAIAALNQAYEYYDADAPNTDEPVEYFEYVEAA